MKVVAGCIVVYVLLVGASTSAALDPPRLYLDPAWSPDGKSIAFVDNDLGRDGARGDLFVMNADGSNVRKLTQATGADDSRGARFPTWSPDSRRIAFGFGYENIDVINADGTGLRKVTTGCCADWSPGGRWIAFIDGFETEPSQVYVVSPDGHPRRLVAAAQDECGFGSPTWSPRGQQLAFAVNVTPECNDVPRTGAISTFRGRIRTLMEQVAAGDPDWSSGGRRIVYAEDRSDLYVRDLKTGKDTHVGSGWHARWSPNSRRIVFTDYRSIRVMNADGTQATKLYPR